MRFVQFLMAVLSSAALILAHLGKSTALSEWNMSTDGTASLALMKTVHALANCCITLTPDITYILSFSNTGSAPLTGVTLIDILPQEVDPLSTDGGTYFQAEHKVKWNIGNLAVAEMGSKELNVSKKSSYNSPPQGTTLLNQAEITSDTIPSTTVHVSIDICGHTPPTLTTFADPVVVIEGEEAKNTGVVDDADGNDLILVSSIGSIVPASVMGGSTFWSWSYTTADGPQDSQTVQVNATDSLGGIATTSFDLQVENGTPLLTVQHDIITVNEGTDADNTGTVSDPGDSVTLSASVGNVLDNGDGTWDWNLNNPNGPDDTQRVEIVATDSDGATTSIEFQLIVNNVPPLLTVKHSIVTVPEGHVASNEGTFSDLRDPVSLSASVGHIQDNGDSTWSWFLNHFDGPADSQTVLVNAIDSNNATQVTFELHAFNVAPKITVDQTPLYVIEGRTAVRTFSVHDPSPKDTIEVTSSIGTITDYMNGTYSWMHQTTDGPDESTVVNITATDSDSDSETINFELIVLDAAPIVQCEHALVEVDEGSTAYENGTCSDPGNDEVNLTSSCGEVDTGIGEHWAWHFDAVDGPADCQDVTVTGKSNDGGEGSVTFKLVVNNVAPEIQSIDLITRRLLGQKTSHLRHLVEQSSVEATVTFTDPGVLDTHTAIWNWGDDTNDIQTNVSSPFTGNHAYSSPGTYEIILEVIDSDGDSAFRTIQYTYTSHEYLLISSALGASSEWCVELSGSEPPVERTRTRLALCDMNEVAQMWKFDSNMIHPASAADRCLHVRKIFAPYRLRVESCAQGEVTQQWEFNQSAGVLKPKGDKNFCVQNRGINTNNGDPIKLMKCDGKLHQQWELIETSL